MRQQTDTGEHFSRGDAGAGDTLTVDLRGRSTDVTVNDGASESVNVGGSSFRTTVRYQKTAKVNQVYDDDARKKLFEKLNRVAANLGLAVIENPAKAKEQAAPEPAPAPQLAAPSRRPRTRKRKRRRGELAERLEKARSGEADPRRSKPFPLPGLAGAWLNLAGFG